jgi:hypothetical protein
LTFRALCPLAQGANEKISWEILRRLSENIHLKLPEKWLNKYWSLHHDNAPTHVSLVMRQLLAATNTPVTPTSLLTGPINFFLFPKMKLMVKYQLFDSTENIQTES